GEKVTMIVITARNFQRISTISLVWFFSNIQQLIKLAIFELNVTFDNDNYVNKLSIWAAYFIFPHSLGYFAKCWWYPYTVTHKSCTV
ncbi:hypothetical protein, partial [Bacillus cereus]